jgi:hypothetical protein
VTSQAIRNLIHDEILQAKQYVFDARWRILAKDLDRPEVQMALSNRRKLSGRPFRISPVNPTDKIRVLEEDLNNETQLASGLRDHNDFEMRIGGS